ncbi:hypothetical protein SAMN04489798_3011 [Pseudomonas arsenicoxydans]|uniref:ABC-three component systems C-terminal domain-containing protein n=1 Tax=Pseudomonas arsenicoxydans TaxID=702115 RepID=A0A1H0JRT6_9PSED|nr:ABC-three component system protein [Pseudomonas arsenicoxydans]SDO46222.1 hypothetical protein SAMN04489798_3011 [Pseudomonas arsenicoxydans]
MSIGESAITIPPAPEFMLTALDVEKGEPVHPLDRLQIMSADAWEVFTLEFVSYLGKGYESVTRCAGAGDKGRDVIAKYAMGWDNYQCKHYKDKLSVANVVAELGKLVYYTWRGDYTLPREYRFVSPKGCSSDCIDMLAKKSRIKAEIIKRWDKACKDKITKTESIPLEGTLLDYLNALDFSFVDEMSSHELIEKHALTPYHTTRFGSYHLKRPQVRKPESSAVGDNEKVYIDALLDAFSDADGAEYSFDSVMDTEYKDDFERARINFFSAESLEMFSRDAFPTGCYEKLKGECHEGVHSVVRKKFDDGYQRFLEVSTHCVKIPYDSHPLRHFLQTSDRKGLCHQLVNDLKFKWIKK